MRENEHQREHNGLLRQYLPKGQSMAVVTQHDCNQLAARLNHRPLCGGGA